MLVTGKMYEVMDSEVGGVGEKHVEYKADTEYWRRRLFVGGDVDKPKKFSSVRVYNSFCFDDGGKWFDVAFKGVVFVPETAHQGRAGPYSNGAHFDLDGDCWGVNLGEVLRRHTQARPQYNLRERSSKRSQDDGTGPGESDFEVTAAGSAKKKRSKGAADKRLAGMNKENEELRSALHQAEAKFHIDEVGLRKHYEARHPPGRAEQREVQGRRRCFHPKAGSPDRGSPGSPGRGSPGSLRRRAADTAHVHQHRCSPWPWCAGAC